MEGRFWLVDASPHIGRQLDGLRSQFADVEFSGLLLTHAHIGHYLGLAFLGREALNSRLLPVWCTPRMAAFLKHNQPWQQLVSLENIEIHEVSPGNPIPLSEHVTALPISVPHRDELSDTVAWRLRGAEASLVYCPDIDAWEGEILHWIRECDIALLDGTFFTSDELPTRDRREIPHPPIEDAVERLDTLGTIIRFIHFNHSNRLLGDPEALTWLQKRGFDISHRGDRWRLA